MPDLGPGRRIVPVASSGAGMDLYCPGTPPPLIGGAKVSPAVARRRGATTSSDSVCMMKDLNDCVSAYSGMPNAGGRVLRGGAQGLVRYAAI